jgi:[ribosomal protein S5]-alanine N-acetyltransferase
MRSAKDHPDGTNFDSRRIPRAVTRIECGGCVIRSWRESDAEELQVAGDDREVSQYLRDRFCYPYTLADARAWIAMSTEDDPSSLAIEVDGLVAGATALELYAAERRHTSELGYWLARSYWGRGIATEVCAAMTRHAFEHFGLVRVQAEVYGPNAASMRVLEKCGFQVEGVRRKAILKGETYLDATVYANLRS